MNVEKNSEITHYIFNLNIKTNLNSHIWQSTVWFVLHKTDFKTWYIDLTPGLEISVKSISSLAVADFSCFIHGEKGFLTLTAFRLQSSLIVLQAVWP